MPADIRLESIEIVTYKAESEITTIVSIRINLTNGQTSGILCCHRQSGENFETKTIRFDANRPIKVVEGAFTEDAITSLRFIDQDECHAGGHETETTSQIEKTEGTKTESPIAQHLETCDV